MDEREVVEVVVVEAELAERRHEDDLPQRAHGHVERAVNLRRDEDRPRDQHRFEAEDRQPPCRHLTVEHLHDRSLRPDVYCAASFSTTPSSLPPSMAAMAS